MNDQDVRAAGAAAMATLLGAAALTPVYSSAAWLAPVVAVVLTVLAGGLLLRAGGPAAWAFLTHGRPPSDGLSALGVALVPVGQLALVICVLTALFAPAHAIAGVIPTRSSLAQLAAVLAQSPAELREQATPALPLAGLLALTALFVGLLAVLVDLVTVAGRQASLGGLGLLVLYCVPVVTITGTIGLVALVAPAAGLALLLWTDQHRRLAGSGRTARRIGSAGGVAALRIGAAALLAGVVLGSLVPTLTGGSLVTGLGGGSGGGATGTSLDPVTTMAGQLTLPEPIDLLQEKASVDDPGYLRAVAVDEYDNESGWTLSNMRGEESIADDDRLAPLPDRQSTRSVTATISVLEHEDRFLPVLFSPLSVRLEGGGDRGWRFDPDTGTVYGRGVTSRGRTYTVTATEPRPTGAELAAARPLSPGSPVQQRFTALPLLDPQVTDLVTEVTAGAGTPYERVRGILDFLTNRANGFVYSLSTAPGTSGDDLLDFLTLRRGYCEQYAGAMAVMVRAAGVPARVALGYTPGTEQDDGSRLITSDDAHAWVEVYFENLGWVPFDPTPIARDRAVDLPWAPRADEQTPDNRADAPLPTAPSQPVPSAQEDRGPDGVPVAQSGQGGDDLLGTLLAGVGIALLAGALLASPGAARALQRRRRVAAGTAGALWDELTATAVDVGMQLHPTWTPRRSARELGTALSGRGRDGGPGADAVLRLALAEESASYGPPVGGRVHADLPAALRTARRALLASVPRAVRLRALVWPTSLVSGAGSRVAAGARRRLFSPSRRRGRRTRTV